MMIQSIEISNFRGVHNTKKFKLYGKTFILLSAPNGLGKTTLIDAIEWCLTGNIGRLKTAFDNRSTNSNERKQNMQGILKNKNATQTEEVSVVLLVTSNNISYQIKRTQKKDELDETLSSFWIDGKQVKNRSWADENIGRNFYNFHFCDVQKSIEMQSRKRKDLPDLFKDFITDYSRELCIADNLEIFVADTERYIDDLDKERVTGEEIDHKKKKLSKFVEAPEIVEYPSRQMFENEKQNIAALTEDELKQQQQQLFLCGYKRVQQQLDDIQQDTKLKKSIDILINLRDIIGKKKEKIEEAIKYNLHLGNQIIEDYEVKIRENSKIELTRNSIAEYSTKIIALGHSEFTKEKYNIVRKEIDEVEDKIKNLNEEIRILSKGNKILDAFSSMLAKQDSIKEYRRIKLEESKKVKCPVCGSYQFGDIREEELFEDVNEYMKQHSDMLTKKKEELEHRKKSVDSLYDKLVDSGKKAIEEAIKKDKDKMKKLNLLKNETIDYFDKVKKIQEEDAELFAIEKMVSEEYIKNLLKSMQNKTLADEIIVQMREEYKKVLDLLNYSMQEDETEDSTIQRVNSLAMNAPEIENYSFEVLTQKINSINSYLTNKEFLSIRKELDDSLLKNKSIEEQKKQYENVKIIAKERAGRIRYLVNQLMTEEYANVGPNLYKYYKKLSRINSINEIELCQDGEKLSIRDESGRNVVNILSNGQLSVFMLAYFFAGIATRSHDEKCKIYFIDDLTACMDDVNMLAFLDLMKYQLLERDGSIEQLFFASCDERICKLLHYKLEGCGIEYRELTEADFT